MLGYLITLAAGMVAGALGQVFLVGPISRLRRRAEAILRDTRLGRRLADRVDPEAHTLAYDPQRDGLFELWSWSANVMDPRILGEDQHVMKLGPAPKQVWVNEHTLARAQEHWRKVHALNQGGQCPDEPTVAYVTSFTQDHGEFLGHGLTADHFDITVAPAFYSDAEAAGSCFRTDDDRERLRQMLTTRTGPALLAGIPPCRASVQVALVSKQHRLLAIQRSRSVESDPGVWTIGPNETLTPPPPHTGGARRESLFTLAERCVQEEVGLHRSEFGPIRFSWFGISVPALGAASNPNESDRITTFEGYRSEAKGIYQLFLAHAACFTGEEQVLRKLRDAHSNFEAKEAAWLDLSKEQANSILEGRDGRLWISFAPLAVRELWRFRKVLFADLEHAADAVPT